jgi:hypothetical protein
MYLRFVLVVVCVMSLPAPPAARAVEASDPQGVTLSCYDTGIALVNELRRVNAVAGENAIRFHQLPAQIDAASVAISPAAGRGSMVVLDQRLDYDAASLANMVERFVGRPVAVRRGGQRVEGVLRGTGGDASAQSLVLLQADGAAVSVPLNDPGVEVIFPGAAAEAALEPTLTVKAESTEEGLQNIRLSYLAAGITWRAQYEVLLLPERTLAQLNCNVSVENASGGSFAHARLRLVQTERGSRSPLVPTAAEEAQWNAQTPAMRYPYAGAEPAFERLIAGLVPVQAFELPRPVDLPRGAAKHVQLARVERLPVTRFYVYDGVRFDRFQRNRRNDWSYGTEFHNDVDTHLEFDNTAQNGLGQNLPPGRIRLYEVSADGDIDLLGDGYFLAVGAGGSGRVRLGPARGLRGERERTGYSEVKPLHEYEETFEIRLTNESKEPAVVRVVEHLYRWHDFEIVGADAEYNKTGPQTIEFRPELKAGGRRSIHYTVRYRW